MGRPYLDMPRGWGQSCASLQCPAARPVVAPWRRAPQWPGGEGEGSVVCLCDAFHDCQAETHTCVVGVYAFGATLERLDKRGNQPGGKVLPDVFDPEQHIGGMNAGSDPYGAPVGQVVDDGVVHEVRRQLEQELTISSSPSTRVRLARHVSRDDCLRCGLTRFSSIGGPLLDGHGSRCTARNRYTRKAATTAGGPKGSFWLTHLDEARTEKTSLM
jgi:hypothetical protein